MKIGAVKLSAVASASGIRESVVNHPTIATMPISARSRCSRKRPVRSTPTPCRSSQGNIASRPNAVRKNTTWSGWRSSVNCRTRVIIRAKQVAAAHIQSTPRSGADRPAPARTLLFGERGQRGHHGLLAR